MFERLPVALAQIKTGNTSENLQVKDMFLLKIFIRLL